MTARLMTFLIWAAVLAGAVAWGLPLFTRGTPVPAGASLAQPAPPAGAGLARLLGQAPAALVEEAPVVVADSRFQLLGVVAPRRAGDRGLALIVVDGKPARAVREGRELEPGLRLLRVSHRQAELGAGGGAPSVTLTLPPLAEAQRGRPGEAPGGMPPGQPALGVPGLPPGMGGAVPGMLRVPPMPGTQLQRLPQVQMPGLQPPQAFIRPVQPEQGDGNAGSLPYQPDGSAPGEQAPVNPSRMR